jgi:hypothetical protein
VLLETISEQTRRLAVEDRGVRDIPIAGYGVLPFRTDQWAGARWTADAPPATGPVEVVVFPARPSGVLEDPGSVDVDGLSSRVVAMLQRIADIDSEARTYLAVNAPEDVEHAGGLIMPSLNFWSDEPCGSFTIFYHGSDEADEVLYGVEFRDFRAFDLVIGDWVARRSPPSLCRRA